MFCEGAELIRLTNIAEQVKKKIKLSDNDWFNFKIKFVQFKKSDAKRIANYLLDNSKPSKREAGTREIDTFISDRNLFYTNIQSDKANAINEFFKNNFETVYAFVVSGSNKQHYKIRLYRVVNIEIYFFDVYSNTGVYGCTSIYVRNVY